VFDQRIHEIDMRRLFLIDRRSWIPASNGPLRVHCGIQRRDAIGAGRSRISAVVEQVLSDVELPVQNGKRKRAHLVRCRQLIDIRTSLYQRFDGCAITVAGGKLKRGQSAECQRSSTTAPPRTTVRVLLALLALLTLLSLLALLVLLLICLLIALAAVATSCLQSCRHERERVQIRAPGGENFNRIRAAESGREHQRRLALIDIFEIRIGAVIEQSLNRRRTA